MISLTSPTKIWAHRLPAGVKLAALPLTTLALFAVSAPAPLGLACVATAALYLSAGPLFARAGITSLRPLWPFLLVIALWHGISGEIAAGLTISLRLINAVALANFVTMTTPLSDMIAVLSWLLTPLRKLGLSTRAIELSIALVIRFTPALTHKGERLAEAWRARARRRPSWKIITPMAALALDDADHVALALRARGGLEPPPTSPPNPSSFPK
ncbi:Energy-coupling factor transporter transmembrane protein BioN [Aquimixticola soesokkakensis]|uniref:Energy-coupling factor transporter transmembrane protein BioN n=1 Tax=Aquimixticola soesokkakensis TaxID=1519096 RepID=A0A1Y5TJ22_9RHOB|nr:CbiQ family ECF transporter T component [Aquimixticola soesokkakensis]SLN63076.1 Energy-coupling factor transporter transmembrane protein BioN [Aquimixticola soesokkakensis]